MRPAPSEGRPFRRKYRDKAVRRDRGVKAPRAGFLAAVTGSSLWGLSGTAAQVIFEGSGFPVWGLVTIRMLGASLLLFVVLRPKWPRPWTLPFASLAVFGLAGSQATYLEAIFYTGVTTATLLQFLTLPIVAVFELATGALRWTAQWAALLLLVTVGTVLLVGTFTVHGIFVAVTPLGLVFGLLSAACGAYYLLGSRRFVHAESASWVTTWGFLLGGVVTAPLGAWGLSRYSWPTSIAHDGLLVGLILFVVVGGTLLAYTLYIWGLRDLRATETALAGSLEPIVAAIAGFVVLGVVLTPAQYFGGALIVGAVVWLGATFRAPRARRAGPARG